MKLSFSTNAFTRYSVFTAVQQIAAIGYAGVELLADVPHLYPPSTREADLKRLHALLNRSRIQVANINANTAVGYYGKEFWEPLFEPSLANPDPVARNWRIDYTKRCLEMARVLGCANVSVTSGRMVPGVEPERSRDLLRESLRQVLEYAARLDVRVGIEYEPGLLIECCQELATLLRDLNSPFLGANLDLGHSHLLGEDPREVIESLGARIFHVHIEDIHAGKHYHLIPGLGEIDFEELFRILTVASFDGFATVELYTYPHQPEPAARRAYDFLAGLAGRSGKETG